MYDNPIKLRSVHLQLTNKQVVYSKFNVNEQIISCTVHSTKKSEPGANVYNTVKKNTCRIQRLTTRFINILKYII